MNAIADALVWFMDEVGFAICHQMPSRTLHYGGRALPVCARDTGLFLGFAVCLAVLLVAYRGRGARYPSWLKIAILAAFVIPMVIDAATSYAGLRETTNAVRLVTGALAGTGLAALVFPLASGELFRRVEDGERPRLLEGRCRLPCLLLIPAGIWLALWPDWPGAYWVWAPLVTIAILFTLFSLNFTLVSLVLEWAVGEERVPGPAVMALIGLGAAAIEIIGSNRLHWLLTR